MGTDALSRQFLMAFSTIQTTFFSQLQQVQQQDQFCVDKINALQEGRSTDSNFRWHHNLL